ncbi:hypothetical protein HYFRA_00004276 [Hymenoscyphus fraxineus]|uniref:CCHC-type domain-containing protein n=1 Tax=Hymenoscyphus fraxineus TaxID=746836 RepID=A0A9N9KLK1_9HELO|nr:hypothetical protein HYFRA_00004276 [Hymenoscyphus fraxineus]
MAPPQEILTEEDLEEIKRRLAEDDPQLDQDAALAKYVAKYKVKGVFFTDTIGRRCVFGPDVINYKYKTHHGHNPELKYKEFVERVIEKDATRIHHLFKPIPLSHVDQPNPEGFRLITGHRSEFIGKGWAVPRNHQSHILNWPPELRLRVLQFVLVSSPSTVVKPQIIGGTAKNREQPTGTTSYKLYPAKGDTREDEIPEYANVRRHDEKGTYFEKRLIKRSTIDATCLRTCKKLYEEGSGVLYGGSIFSFEMANSSFIYSSRPVVDSSGVIFHTSATKPGPENIRGVVKDGLSRIQHDHPWRMLPGWIFYDPFLRFLYTIRPRNAALIKHLEFDGIVKGHTCDNCKCCYHDLIRSMRIYVNFMARFCTSLIKLNILACSDSRLNHGFIVSEDLSVANPNNLPIIPPWRPTNVKDGLTKLFEQSISRITTLQKIDIRTTEIHYTHNGELEYYPADFGEELISRTLAQIQKRREKQEDRGMRRYPKKKQCGFCGENHNWRNCYNLCALCGEYGHFKSSCPNWDSISKSFYGQELN